MLAWDDGKRIYLKQLDAKDLLVVSVSQVSEKQLLYNPWHFPASAQTQ